MKTHNAPLTVAGVETADLGAASFNTGPYRLENFSWFSITGTVSGASALNGTLKLQASNDLGFDNGATITGVTNWVDLASSSQAITANGSVQWNYNGAGFRWLRVVYTRTAGSGTLLLRINAKGAV